MDERILALAELVAADIGYRIVRVRVESGKRRKIQIMAERLKDGLMNVDDCAALSRELSSVLDLSLIHI